jgi:hypothetical protein
MTHPPKRLHNTCCAQYRSIISRRTCRNAGNLQQLRAGPPENGRHSGIGWHTPASVHFGTADAIDEARQITLTAAYHANPARFGRRPTPPKRKAIFYINEPETQIN